MLLLPKKNLPASTPAGHDVQAQLAQRIRPTWPGHLRLPLDHQRPARPAVPADHPVQRRCRRHPGPSIGSGQPASQLGNIPAHLAQQRPHLVRRRIPLPEPGFRLPGRLGLLQPAPHRTFRDTHRLSDRTHMPGRQLPRPLPLQQPAHHQRPRQPSRAPRSCVPLHAPDQTRPATNDRIRTLIPETASPAMR